MKILGLIVLSAIVCATCAPAAGIDQFVGEWKSLNGGRSIASISIRASGSVVSVRAFGVCNPVPCDWGEVTAEPYAPVPNPQAGSAVQALVAHFTGTADNRMMIVHSVSSDSLRVDVFTNFNDNSGRAPYETTVILIKAGSAAGEDEANVPVPLDPPANAVFNNFPRTTTLRWTPVPGATRYGVEVDCYLCCAKGRWCSDANGPTQIAESDTTQFTFDFVGAQPGRWRVWAIGADGKAGTKSKWRTFRYTH